MVPSLVVVVVVRSSCCSLTFWGIAYRFREFFLATFICFIHQLHPLNILSSLSLLHTLSLTHSHSVLFSFYRCPSLLFWLSLLSLQSVRLLSFLMLCSNSAIVMQSTRLALFSLTTIRPISFLLYAAHSFLPFSFPFPFPFSSTPLPLSL